MKTREIILMKIPTHYTTVEGGFWKRWPKRLRGSVQFFYKIAPDRWNRCVIHKGIRVHSLRGKDWRWDCCFGLDHDFIVPRRIRLAPLLSKMLHKRYNNPQVDNETIWLRVESEDK